MFSKPIERRRRDGEALGQSACMKSPIPHCDDQIRRVDGEGARQVDGVGAAKSSLRGQLAGLAFHPRSQLHRAHRRPQILPRRQCGPSLSGGEVGVAF
jgi:hypothetical protein